MRRGDVTLDVGCGTGISTLYAAPIASRVFALDASSAMMRGCAASFAAVKLRSPNARMQPLVMRGPIGETAVIMGRSAQGISPDTYVDVRGRCRPGFEARAA